MITDNLTLKAFLSGLREPLGSLIRSRNPISLEIALTHILIEENINYTRNRNNHLNLQQKQHKITTQTHVPRNAASSNSFPQSQRYQMPVRQYAEPKFNYNNMPRFPNQNFSQIPRPNFSQFPRTNSFGQHHPQQNFQRNAFQPRGNQPSFKPLPMDTTSGSFAKRNTSGQTPIPKRQRPNFASEELFYQDDAANYEDYYYEYNDQTQDEYQTFYEQETQQFEDDTVCQQD